MHRVFKKNAQTNLNYKQLKKFKLIKINNFFKIIKIIKMINVNKR
jgi:hypothetical protein